jgi:hypothetical protein
LIRFLRTASLRRLLAAIAGTVVAIGGGTAIALAATGNGPVPKREPLAKAIRQALAAPKLSGISADITYTNHLFTSAELPGQASDPLLEGASGRFWYAPAQHSLRLELQTSNGDSNLLMRGRRFWVSDPAQQIVYEGTLPAGASSPGSGGAGEPLPSAAQIKAQLDRLARRLDISQAIPGDIGGQPTYTVRVSPRRDRGLLGGAQLAFDAARGVPLEFSVYATGNPSPVLQIQASAISFGPVSPSVFAIAPPYGYKVVRVSLPAGGAPAAHAHALHGVAAVQRALPFKLAAPAQLAGLARHDVVGAGRAGGASAIITYGRGLGSIVVIERAAAGAGPLLGAGRMGQAQGTGGLVLPTVKIDGVKGRELDTALGTVLSFERGGVSYTLLGSVTPRVAERAARQL